MVDRLNCCVPYCRRTIKAGDFNEWVCGRHWPLVPRRLKRRKNAMAKIVRRAVRANPKVSEYWLMPPGSPERIKAVRMWKLMDNIWVRCKAAAIEAAAGI